MRNVMEMTSGYQLWRMVKRWLYAVGVCALVQAVFVISTYGKDILRNITGVCVILAYFGILCSGAMAMRRIDEKTYTPTTYDIKKPIIWGFAIALMSALTIVIFKLNWSDGTPIVWVNLICLILQSPYLAFTIMTPGEFSALLTVISIALPPVACVTGYIIGKNEFFIADKLQAIMFEKDKKDI